MADGCPLGYSHWCSKLESIGPTVQEILIFPWAADGEKGRFGAIGAPPPQSSGVARPPNCRESWPRVLAASCPKRDSVGPTVAELLIFQWARVVAFRARSRPDPPGGPLLGGRGGRPSARVGVRVPRAQIPNGESIGPTVPEIQPRQWRDPADHWSGLGTLYGLTVNKPLQKPQPGGKVLETRKN